MILNYKCFLQEKYKKNNFFSSLKSLKYVSKLPLLGKPITWFRKKHVFQSCSIMFSNLHKTVLPSILSLFLSTCFSQKHDFKYKCMFAPSIVFQIFCRGLQFVKYLQSISSLFVIIKISFFCYLSIIWWWNVNESPKFITQIFLVFNLKVSFGRQRL